MDMYLERLLRQHRQLDSSSARILEINPAHPLIRQMAVLAGDGSDSSRLADVAHLLLDQARIVEGEPVADALAFSNRLAAVMEKSLPAAPSP
jgi:molecular chaperone HtpG